MPTIRLSGMLNLPRTFLKSRDALLIALQFASGSEARPQSSLFCRLTASSSASSLFRRILDLSLVTVLIVLIEHRAGFIHDFVTAKGALLDQTSKL